MYQTYCSDASKEDEEVVEIDLQKEYARQRDHMERTVAALKTRLTNHQVAHRTGNSRTMAENVVLIKEINAFRKDVYNIQQKDKKIELLDRNDDDSNASSKRSMYE